MELLQFLLSFFAKEQWGEKFEPILNILQKNSFDLKKTLQELDINTLTPILKDLVFKNENASQNDTLREASGLSPISNFADRKIVEKLNCYFSD